MPGNALGFRAWIRIIGFFSFVEYLKFEMFYVFFLFVFGKFMDSNRINRLRFESMFDTIRKL